LRGVFRIRPTRCRRSGRGHGSPFSGRCMAFGVCERRRGSVVGPEGGHGDVQWRSRPQALRQRWSGLAPDPAASRRAAAGSSSTGGCGGDASRFAGDRGAADDSVRRGTRILPGGQGRRQTCDGLRIPGAGSRGAASRLRWFGARFTTRDRRLSAPRGSARPRSAAPINDSGGAHA